MTAQPLLPGLDDPPPEVTFTCVPDHVANHPGKTPTRLEVLRAIIAAARSQRHLYPGDAGWVCAPTRAELRGLTGLSIASISAAIAWLVAIGALLEIPDPTVQPRRRFRLMWRHARGVPDLTPPAPAPDPSTAGRPSNRRMRPESGPMRPESGPMRPAVGRPPYRESVRESEENVNAAAPPGETSGGGPPPVPAPPAAATDPDRAPRAAEVLARVRDLGYGPTLLEATGQVHLSGFDPADLPPGWPELRAALADLKPEIVAILRAESPPASGGPAPPAAKPTHLFDRLADRVDPADVDRAVTLLVDQFEDAHSAAFHRRLCRDVREGRKPRALLIDAWEAAARYDDPRQARRVFTAWVRDGGPGAGARKPAAESLPRPSAAGA